MRLRESICLVILTALFATACGATSSQPVASPVAEVAATDAPTTPPDSPSPQATSTLADEMTSSDQVTPIQTATAAYEPTATATLEPAPTATIESDWLTTEGKTDEDFTYLGNPNAPITIIDYSDFM